MKFFIDLIAKSYLEYTQEKDHYIAHFFFHEFHKVRPGSQGDLVFSKKQFYNSLMKKFNSLISESYSMHTKYNGFPEDVASDMIQEARERALDQDALHQKTLDMIHAHEYYRNPNWEKCNNADKLTHALGNLGVVLKDPINIIKPNIAICTERIVLRKSILEYLKKEAVRASKVDNIEELDDFYDEESHILKDSHSKTSDAFIDVSDKNIKIEALYLRSFQDQDNRAKKAQIFNKQQNEVPGLNENYRLTATNQESSLLLPEPLTIATIKDNFEGLGKGLNKGWGYAFTCEKEFEDFVYLLALTLEKKPLTLPNNKFKLKKRTKTKVSAVLRSLHKEISYSDDLRNDSPFFSLISTLSIYEDMDHRDIYDSLTR